MSAGLGIAIAHPSHAHGPHHSHSTDTQVAEAAPQPVTFTVQQVRDNVYVISGSNGAGNVGVLMGDVGPILIDSQMPGLGSNLNDVIMNEFNRRPTMVINTHWHFDHTGGNEFFGANGMAIVAHTNARDRMERGQVIEPLDITIDPAPAVALPVVTYTESMTFHVNGDTTQLFHVGNAHTDGDAVVHFQKANVIHTGDVVFNGLYPFIDLSSNGSINGMIAAVEQILAVTNEDTKIIPGHGPLMDREGLLEYYTLLTTVRDRMEAAIAQGHSLETILGMKLNADYDETHGNAFLSPEQFATILYQDLSR